MVKLIFDFLQSDPSEGEEPSPKRRKQDEDEEETETDEEAAPKNVTLLTDNPAANEKLGIIVSILSLVHHVIQSKIPNEQWAAVYNYLRSSTTRQKTPAWDTFKTQFIDMTFYPSKRMRSLPHVPSYSPVDLMKDLDVWLPPVVRSISEAMDVKVDYSAVKRHAVQLPFDYNKYRGIEFGGVKQSTEQDAIQLAASYDNKKFCVVDCTAMAVSNLVEGDKALRYAIRGLQETTWKDIANHFSTTLLGPSILLIVDDDAELAYLGHRITDFGMLLLENPILLQAYLETGASTDEVSECLHISSCVRVLL